MAKLATQHITAGSPLVINKDNGDYIAYAEEIVLRGDASEENKGKELLTYIEEAIKSIKPGGGSGGDITINDAILGGGLSFKNDKIELNLEDSLKIENDKLGIKAPPGSGLKVSSSGVYLNVDPNHFEIGSNMLKLKNTSSGGGGDYVLQEASHDTLGGIYIHTGVDENDAASFIIPICKDDTKSGTTIFGLMASEDGPFENDAYLNIKPGWMLKDKYRSDSYISFNLGTAITNIANNINDKTIFGNKENYPGPRTVYFDNIVVSTEKGWPVTGKVSGHLVVNKSFPENASRYTHSQVLYITNGTGNEHKIFMRDGEGGFTSDGTELVSEWRPWKEIQGMAILQGGDGNFAVTDTDLNKIVDNGMYAGVYQTDDYTMDEENMIITGVETFTMIVVNNYAMAAVFDEFVSPLNMHFPKQVIQYKISSPLYGTPVANGSVDTPDPNLFKGKVQMRTGVYHDTTNTYVFTEWESIGGSIPIV